MTFTAQRNDEWSTASVASTLAARDYKSPRVLATGLDSQLNGSEELYGPLISTGGSRNQFVATIPILEASGRRSNATDSGMGIGADGDPMYTLQSSQQHAIAYQCQDTNVGEMGTLRAGNGHVTGGVPFVAATSVRRLVPTECLRLQGFPDDHLDLDPPLSDSAKYRMTGNACTVSVCAYLGNRIRQALEDGQ